MRGPQQESTIQQLDPRQQTTKCLDTTVTQQPKSSRLAKVKQVLLGRGSLSSSNDGSVVQTTTTTTTTGPNYSGLPSFGVKLELVHLHNETGVPYVVHRLCSYLEKHQGFKNPGLFKQNVTIDESRLSERLRLSFDRRGDADLEATNCPATVALLIKQYVKELPDPIVGATCISKLLQLHAR